MARYTVGDNWRETKAAIDDMMWAWTGGEPETVLTDFEDGAALGAMLDRTSPPGDEPVVFQDWELDRWLDETRELAS